MYQHPSVAQAWHRRGTFPPIKLRDKQGGRAAPQHQHGIQNTPHPHTAVPTRSHTRTASPPPTSPHGTHHPQTLLGRAKAKHSGGQAHDQVAASNFKLKSCAHGNDHQTINISVRPFPTSPTPTTRRALRSGSCHRTFTHLRVTRGDSAPSG